MSLNTEKAHLEAQLQQKQSRISARLQEMKADIVGEKSEGNQAIVSKSLQLVQDVSAKIPRKVWLGVAGGILVAGYLLSRKNNTVKVPVKLEQGEDGQNYAIMKKSAVAHEDMFQPLRAVGQVAVAHVIELISDSLLQMLKKR